MNQENPNSSRPEQDDSDFLAEMIFPFYGTIVSYASSGINPLEDVEEDRDADLPNYTEPEYDSIYYRGEQDDSES